MNALPQASHPDFAQARYHMLESQLRPHQVTEERLLAAFFEAPREQFVPSTLAANAYRDQDIILLPGRALIQPMVLGRLLQAAAIKATDHVLDLAPATGYSTFIIARLAKTVTGVEPNALLHKEAVKTLAALACQNAAMLAGAPVEGCKAEAPFDVIFINGSVEFIPELLFEQLADGGRLVTVTRRFGPAHLAHVGLAGVYVKQDNQIIKTTLFDANIAPAPGFHRPQGFTF